MKKDDLIALASISTGAATSLVLTLAILLAASSSAAIQSPEPFPVVLEAFPPAFHQQVVDFAIIRGNAEVMVGPESPETGWSPPTAESGFGYPR